MKIDNLSVTAFLRFASKVIGSNVERYQYVFMRNKKGAKLEVEMADERFHTDKRVFTFQDFTCNCINGEEVFDLEAKWIEYLSSENLLGEGHKKEYEALIQDRINNTNEDLVK